MIRIEIEDCKDRVLISFNAEGTSNELVNELTALISERNAIVMNALKQGPDLAPLLSKRLKEEGLA